MDYAVIRYQVKKECQGENRVLIQSVFRELHDAAPPELRYMVLELADGTFVHVVGTPAGETARALTETPAFRAFASTLVERQVAPAERWPATIVGNWQMLGEASAADA
jgi:hypothetical protein